MVKKNTLKFKNDIGNDQKNRKMMSENNMSKGNS